jgi:hypothetical protein
VPRAWNGITPSAGGRRTLPYATRTPVSIVSCSHWAVAQTSRMDDPGRATAGDLANVGRAKLYQMIRNLIYDVGMHEGEDTKFFIERGFKVVGIEANPQLVARIRETLARPIAEGKLQIVGKAPQATAKCN